MTNTNTTPKAAAVIKSMKTRQLIETFILTDSINDSNVYIVRGWIMDELERRNPEAFDAWLESETCEDNELFKYFAC